MAAQVYGEHAPRAVGGAPRLSSELLREGPEIARLSEQAMKHHARQRILDGVGRGQWGCTEEAARGEHGVWECGGCECTRPAPRPAGPYLTLLQALRSGQLKGKLCEAAQQRGRPLKALQSRPQHRDDNSAVPDASS